MPIVITPLFNTHADALFDAWTDPAIMRNWLFKGDRSEIEHIEVDLAVDGRFSIVERTPTGLIDHFGNYLLVDRPKLLCFTLEVPLHFPGQSRVTIAFRQGSKDCEMVFEQTGVDPEIVEAEWRRMFSRLAMVLLKGSSKPT
jgi:uncharacterized protein YndB with AHSA1/START domain